jgi:hypothetical protein
MLCPKCTVNAWLTQTRSFTRFAPSTHPKVQLGNHEYDHLSGGGKDRTNKEETETGWNPFWGNFGHDSHGECGVPTLNRFRMPGPWGGGNDGKIRNDGSDGNTRTGGAQIIDPWYAFASGPVTFLMISSEHSWLGGSPQLLWMEQTLAAVNRTATPWVVVAGHRPMYTSEGPAPQDHLVSMYMREHMDGLLSKYRVNLMYGLTCTRPQPNLPHAAPRTPMRTSSRIHSALSHKTRTVLGPSPTLATLATLASLASP